MADSSGKLGSNWTECERGLSGFHHVTLTVDISARRCRRKMLQYILESLQPCLQFFFSCLLCEIALNASSGGFFGGRRMRR